ncbi:MAG: DoxX family membrane protein [Bacteroidaceae bacterium]|nr:DoxX family membrane protein [Bacteroidaceae bacterium]
MAKSVVARILVNICRLIVSLTFIFSGFVKAVDPIGFQYKIQDYVAAITDAYNTGFFHDWGSLIAAVAIAAFEFILGIHILFAINRRLSSNIAWLFMLLMTGITVWIYFDNPVSDCGCFGDAVVLTNGQTLLKNIALLAMTIPLAVKPLIMPRLISKPNQWIVANFSALYIFAISVYCLYDLPLIDFRPYSVGTNIPDAMEIPAGKEQPQFKTTLLYEKDGQRKEFTMDDIPDSTWTFIDSKTEQISEGYVPPIHDFSIIYDGDDITEDILSDKEYSFLLIAPHLETADESQFGEINILAEYAKRNGYRFLCLTASNQEAIENWIDVTGAEYQFANTDETTLKTIVRSSPGLVLLKNGTIYEKWSHNSLPGLDEQSQALDRTEYGSIAWDENHKTMGKALFWYIIPLLILTFFDRLIAGLYALVKTLKDKRKKLRK